MRNKNYMITTVKLEKVFDQIWPSFMVKTLNKAHMEETYLNIIKAICDKPTSDITVSGENWKLSLWNEKQDEDACSHHFYLTQYWKSYLQLSDQKNKNKINEKKERKVIQ